MAAPSKASFLLRQTLLNLSKKDRRSSTDTSSSDSYDANINYNVAQSNSNKTNDPKSEYVENVSSSHVCQNSLTSDNIRDKNVSSTVTYLNNQSSQSPNNSRQANVSTVLTSNACNISNKGSIFASGSQMSTTDSIDDIHVNFFSGAAQPALSHSSLSRPSIFSLFSSKTNEFNENKSGNIENKEKLYNQNQSKYLDLSSVTKKSKNLTHLCDMDSTNTALNDDHKVSGTLRSDVSNMDKQFMNKNTIKTSISEDIEKVSTLVDLMKSINKADPDKNVESVEEKLNDLTSSDDNASITKSMLTSLSSSVTAKPKSSVSIFDVLFQKATFNDKNNDNDNRIQVSPSTNQMNSSTCMNRPFASSSSNSDNSSEHSMKSLGKQKDHSYRIDEKNDDTIFLTFEIYETMTMLLNKVEKELIGGDLDEGSSSNTADEKFLKCVHHNATGSHLFIDHNVSGDISSSGDVLFSSGQMKDKSFTHHDSQFTLKTDGGGQITENETRSLTPTFLRLSTSDRDENDIPNDDNGNDELLFDDGSVDHEDVARSDLIAGDKLSSKIHMAAYCESKSQQEIIDAATNDSMDETTIDIVRMVLASIVDVVSSADKNEKSSLVKNQLNRHSCKEENNNTDESTKRKVMKNSSENINDTSSDSLVDDFTNIEVIKSKEQLSHLSEQIEKSSQFFHNDTNLFSEDEKLLTNNYDELNATITTVDKYDQHFPQISDQSGFKDDDKPSDDDDHDSTLSDGDKIEDANDDSKIDNINNSKTMIEFADDVDVKKDRYQVEKEIIDDESDNEFDAMIENEKLNQFTTSMTNTTKNTALSSTISRLSKFIKEKLPSPLPDSDGLSSRSTPKYEVVDQSTIVKFVEMHLRKRCSDILKDETRYIANDQESQISQLRALAQENISLKNQLIQISKNRLSLVDSSMNTTRTLHRNVGLQVFSKIVAPLEVNNLPSSRVEQITPAPNIQYTKPYFPDKSSPSLNSKQIPSTTSAPAFPSYSYSLRSRSKNSQSPSNSNITSKDVPLMSSISPAMTVGATHITSIVTPSNDIWKSSLNGSSRDTGTTNQTSNLINNQQQNKACNIIGPPPVLLQAPIPIGLMNNLGGVNNSNGKFFQTGSSRTSDCSSSIAQTAQIQNNNLNNSSRAVNNNLNNIPSSVYWSSSVNNYLGVASSQRLSGQQFSTINSLTMIPQQSLTPITLALTTYLNSGLQQPSNNASAGKHKYPVVMNHQDGRTYITVLPAPINTNQVIQHGVPFTSSQILNIIPRETPSVAYSQGGGTTSEAFSVTSHNIRTTPIIATSLAGVCENNAKSNNLFSAVRAVGLNSASQQLQAQALINNSPGGVILPLAKVQQMSSISLQPCGSVNPTQVITGNVFGGPLQQQPVSSSVAREAAFSLQQPLANITVNNFRPSQQPQIANISYGNNNSVMLRSSSQVPPEIQQQHTQRILQQQRPSITSLQTAASPVRLDNILLQQPTANNEPTTLKRKRHKPKRLSETEEEVLVDLTSDDEGISNSDNRPTSTDSSTSVSTSKRSRYSVVSSQVTKSSNFPITTKTTKSSSSTQEEPATTSTSLEPVPVGLFLNSAALDRDDNDDGSHTPSSSAPSDISEPPTPKVTEPSSNKETNSVENNNNKDDDDEDDILEVREVVDLAKRDPPPLPDADEYPTDPSFIKMMPPPLNLTVKRIETGVFTSWSLPDNYKFEHCISCYEMFACCMENTPRHLMNWVKVGDDIKKLPLPMACTLTDFTPGQAYYFAIRAIVNVRNRKYRCRFSEPVFVRLPQVLKKHHQRKS